MDLGPVHLYNKLKPVLGYLAYTASTHTSFILIAKHNSPA